MTLTLYFRVRGKTCVCLMVERGGGEGAEITAAKPRCRLVTLYFALVMAVKVSLWYVNDT